MSWESTVPYYRVINETVRAQLGGLHSAKVILYSVDFHEIERLQHVGDWPEAGRLLAVAAAALEAAGADFLVLCTNTMHKVAPAIESAVSIPLFHIADPTAAEIKGVGLVKVGLLGTRFTMEQAFYRDRLVSLHGIDVLIPSEPDREIVHRIIYDELCMGQVRDTSRAEYQRIIASLVAQGAQAIILGCTEIAMLVGPSDASVPVFDTTGIHARSAAEWAMSSQEIPKTSEP